MSLNQHLKNPKKEKGKSDNSSGLLGSYAQWSGLAFQMAVLVIAGYFAGNKVDQWLKRIDTLYTLIGVVTGVIASMLLAVRMILKKNKNN